MDRNVFREKSIKRLSSPEKLNEYIKICNPSLWIVLAAVILLLVGVVVWSVLGHLDTVLQTVAVCENGRVTAYVKAADRETVVGKEMTVSGQSLIVEEQMCAVEPISVGNGISEHARHIGNLAQGEWVYPITFETDLPNGVYEARIVTDSVQPISFVFN